MYIFQIGFMSYFLHFTPKGRQLFLILYLKWFILFAPEIGLKTHYTTETFLKVCYIYVLQLFNYLNTIKSVFMRFKYLHLCIFSFGNTAANMCFVACLPIMTYSLLYKYRYCNFWRHIADFLLFSNATLTACLCTICLLDALLPS